MELDVIFLVVESAGMVKDKAGVDAYPTDEHTANTVSANTISFNFIQ